MMPWKVSLFSRMKKTLSLPVQRWCRNSEGVQFPSPTHLGGVDGDVMADFYTNACLNIIKLKTRKAEALYGAKYEKVMNFCKK